MSAILSDNCAIGRERKAKAKAHFKWYHYAASSVACVSVPIYSSLIQKSVQSEQQNQD